MVLVQRRPAPRSAERWLILGITCLAFGLRAYHLGYQSLWRDEVDALRFATQAWTGLLAMFREIGQNGPLFFLLLRPWLRLAGQSEFALRFLSAASGTMAVPVTYRLLARLAGRRPALVCALLMAIAPYLLWYGQEAKMYALLTFLVPLELWLLVLAVQTGRFRFWLLLYLVTSLSIYTHLLAALAVLVQILWLLIVPAAPPAADAAEPSLARRALWAAAYLAALVVPYLPVLRWAGPMFLSWSYRTGFAFVPLGTMLRVLAGAFTRGPLVEMGPLAIPLLLVVVSGVLLWSEARGQGGWRLVAMLLAWLLLPILSLYLLSFSVPLFTERYLIWAMPAFLALAALGVAALASTWRYLALALLALIVAVNMAGNATYQNAPLKSDFRSAAQYVLAHQQPGDRLLFQIPYSQYVFAYYAGPLRDYSDGPYTNNGTSQAEVDSWLAAQMGKAPAVWLIASEVPLWDERGLTEAWLAEHGRVTDRADFTQVAVTRYSLQPAAAR